MANEERFVSAALKAWDAYIERADGLFSSLTAEQLSKAVAPGKNRLIYLWGHLIAVHDGMLPLLYFGQRLYPEYDAIFISSADRAVPVLPSVDELKQAWNEVNRKLSAGFAKLGVADWLQKHSAVSDEDFAKEPLRNRFAILLSRTNHLSSHLGQAALAAK